MIRLAVAYDIQQVMELVGQAKSYMHSMGNFQWDNDYPHCEVFVNDIAEQNLFVYEIGNKIAAFIVINNSQPSEYKPLEWRTPSHSLVIHRLVVASTEMGIGLGRKLLQFAEDRASQLSISSIRSDTNSKNLPMLHLFRSLNYRFVGNIVLRNKPDLFCCFEKEL